MDRVELERLERSGDRLDRGRRPRYQVRIRVHEADVAAIRDHLDDVARQQRSPVGPMEHLSSFVVATAADESQTGSELVGLAVPETNRRIWAQHPLPLRLVQVDRARE